jgi:hypothetical protein
MTTNFFSPLSFVAVFGSGIPDPGSRMGKNQDLGSGIRDKHPGSATLTKKTETRSVSVCFMKPKTKNWVCFGLFQCFEPISKQPKQTELFRNKPKQPRIF